MGAEPGCAAGLPGEAVQSCTPAFTHILRPSSLPAVLQLSATNMEALGGVSSAIAIITLALQSTKVIYEVVNSISHGSDDIDRLARATSNLQKLLEDTKQLAEHVKRTKRRGRYKSAGENETARGSMR